MNKQPESNTQETPESLEFDASVDALAALEAEEAKPAKRAQPEAELPEEEEESSEEPGPDEEGGEEEPTDDEQQDTAKYETVDVDGTTYEVPPELKPYILRQQDYTRKTQETATLRKQAEADLQRAQQVRTQYEQGLPILYQALQSLTHTAPDPALLESDPVEYIRQERLNQDHGKKLQAIVAEHQRVSQQVQQEQNAQWQRERKEFAQKLPELIPSWKDKKLAAKEFDEVMTYLAGEGYPADVLGTTTDPIALMVSRKAMLYDKLIAQKKAARPVPTRTAEPGIASRSPQSAVNVKRAKLATQLNKSGSVHDAAALLAALE